MCSLKFYSFIKPKQNTANLHNFPVETLIIILMHQSEISLRFVKNTSSRKFASVAVN